MTSLGVLLFVSTPLPSGLRASVNCTAAAPLGHLWRVWRVNTGTIAVYSEDKQHNPAVLKCCAQVWGL